MVNKTVLEWSESLIPLKFLDKQHNCPVRCVHTIGLANNNIENMTESLKYSFWGLNYTLHLPNVSDKKKTSKNRCGGREDSLN